MDADAATTLDRFRGCLLAGAIGDALGGPIEFASLAGIRQEYGDRIELSELSEARFTDDTQMTLFTAEGLIRANIRGRLRGITTVAGVTHRAYLRWLHTQGVSWADAAGGHVPGSAQPDGWLVTNRVLHRRAAPGNTCLSALHSGVMGTPADRINNSKGCGGVMRSAPVGLFFDDATRAFEIGCEIAAITHGHPSGYLTAGALAAMVSRLLAGDAMRDAVAVGRDLAAADSDGGETVRALDAAVALADSGTPEPEALEKLGGGWVGEEALAIAVACALTAEDLPSALSAAVCTRATATPPVRSAGTCWARSSAWTRSRRRGSSCWRAQTSSTRWPATSGRSDTSRRRPPTAMSTRAGCSGTPSNQIRGGGPS